MNENSKHFILVEIQIWNITEIFKIHICYVLNFYVRTSTFQLFIKGVVNWIVACM
jgi:hypothetical protein